MKAATVSKRWIGMAVLVGLLALLTAGVHAQDPMAAERLAAPAYSIAIHCDTTLLEEGDPFMLVDETEVPCLDIAVPEISSVDFAGNTAWVRLVVNGEAALHVYVKRDGVWERIPYSSQPDWEDLYMREQEDLSMGLANAWPQRAPVEVSADVRGADHLEFLYMLEQENLGLSRLNPDPRTTAQPEAATGDISVDVRGENYWDDWFARQEGASVATPSRAIVPTEREVGAIGLIEDEAAPVSGSRPDTLDELISSVFGSSLAGQAAVWDPARELQDSNPRFASSP